MRSTRKKFTFRKTKALIASLCLAVMLCTVPAFATNWNFGFYFENLNTEYGETFYKSDNESNWYISIIKEYRSSISSTNIFGCKMHRVDNDGVDTYHTFTRYVSGYKIPYIVPVAKDDAMYMGAKKDSASTSNEVLRVCGRFAP